MVYVWRERKLVFFAAPATGSTAFVHHLSSRGFGEYVPAEDISRDGKRIVPRKHSTIREMRNGGVWEREFDEFTKAVGVRNAFSFHVAKYDRNRKKRAASIENKNSWINKLPEVDRKRYVRRVQLSVNQTFEEFLRDQLDREPFDPQAHFHEEIDFYIHQERVSEDVAALFQAIGADLPSEIGEHNVTDETADPERYKERYTPELIDLVMAKNKPFFDRFPEYSFDGLKKSKSRPRKANHGDKTTA